jgi:hypothetical protein
MGRRDDLVEAKEIILREDVTIDLTVRSEYVPDPLQDGQTGVVTVHYAEERVADPPSESDETKPTRIREKAAIRVHRGEPGLLAPENNEPYIRLGIIAFNDMLPVDTRQFVFLQDALFAERPSINVTPNSARANEDLELTVGAGNGFDLTAATAVELVPPPGTTAPTINIVRENISATKLKIKFKVPLDNPIGTYTLKVTVGGRTAETSLTIRPGLKLTDVQGVDEPNGDRLFKIRGSGFEGSVSIEFAKDSSGGFTAPVLLSEANVGSERITIAMGDIPSAAVNGPIRVRSDNQVQPLRDVTLPAALTGVPDSGQRNFNIEITGSRFVPGNTIVTFKGGATATPVPNPAPTDKKFTVKVPNLAQSGKITVKTPGGTVVQSIGELLVTG